VSILNPRKRLRAAPLLVLAMIALALAGCGRTTQTGVSQDQLSNGDEPYFNAGPVTYQVQISRQINAFDSDDVQYLAGVKNAQSIPGTDFWYGVFLWAKNQNQQTEETAGIKDFELTDSVGNVYKPVKLNPSVNPYAWSAQLLGQNEIEPASDSIASNGSSGGSMLLFKLPSSVYSDRPLTLRIWAPGEQKPSYVSLDL
jgi:hypothetical protein